MDKFVVNNKIEIIESDNTNKNKNKNQGQNLKVINFNEINLDKLCVSKRISTPIGLRHFVTLGKYEKFYIETPYMYLPYGIDIEDKGTGDKYWLRCEFKNMEENEELKKFYYFVSNIEDIVISNLKDFYDELSFYTYLKTPEKSMYFSSLKIKLPRRYNRFDVDFFNSQGELKISGEVKKYIWAKLILCPIEIWMNDVHYGILWQAKALILK